MTSAGAFAFAGYALHVLVALAVILPACRVVGWIVRRWLGQPQVVGEMLAGVLLGPSLLGLIFPGAEAAIFPADIRPLLYLGGQLGVALYMFVIGTRFRRDIFRRKVGSAATVSLSGIAVPFLIAIPLTPLLLDVPGLFAASASRSASTLFLGACMALTAFPMLARIIDERGLADSAIGTLTLAAGAFDDVCSWCVLAIILAAFGGGLVGALLAIGGGIVWVIVVLAAGPRLLAPLGARVVREGRMNGIILAITLALFGTSALVTDAIGIHAIFGGFILGTIMPRGLFADELKRRLEPLLLVLLLPLFFTYSGLATRLDLVGSISLLTITALLLILSIAAKGGACFVAARLVGEDRRTAMGIGALMNARGLMELIIINIGLEKGIIGPALFAMLALMAVVTTTMASPLFDLVYGRQAKPGQPCPIAA
jgi:Kef-type K+ transport system membrane component KefB